MKKRASNEVKSSNLVGCQMETFYKEGACGRPATHVWTHGDEETLVCDRCALPVYVNGGDLKPVAPKPMRSRPAHKL
jgi:hypothetical protein